MLNYIIIHQTGRDELYNIWHKNEFSSFLYIHSGEGSIVFSNKIYTLKKGVLCFIPAQKQHYTLPDVPSEYTRSKLGIANTQLSKFISNSINMLSLTSSVVYAPIPPEEQKNIELIWDMLNNTQISGEDRQILENGCILQMLAYLNTYKIDSTKLLDTSIELALDYINSNISSELNVDNICSAAHLSKYYFCHLFKEAIGVSVMKYVWITRLSLAKEMLADNKHSISQISSICGFESVSNFCHLFKKHTGITASQYRKSINLV